MPQRRTIGPYLYLPVEVASRELHAKLLLTYFAVRMGYEVVIGWKKLINQNLSQMPPGIVVFKTLTLGDGRAMVRARAAGHAIAAIDEEVPGLVATKQKLRWVTRQSVDASDLVLAAGADHLEALRTFYPGYADRYRLVGNPRWDLLRPELRGSHAREAAAIRDRYGSFVLVNTNFAVLNSSRRTPEETRAWFVDTMLVDPRKPEDAVFLDEVFAMERANTEAIHELLRALPSRFPNHRFIVRPHPIEREDTWTAALRGLPRVAVVRDGPAVPWIMASDALVHTNCTTGVEAFALGRPAISLQPAKLGVYEVYLSNRINYLTSNVDETLDLLDRLVGPGAAWSGYPAESLETFDHFLEARSGPFSCERIMEAIRDDLGVEPTPEPESPAWRPGPGYFPRVRKTRRHHAQVMPEFGASTVEELLDGFARALEPCGQLVLHVHGAANRADHRLPGAIRARLGRLWPRPDSRGPTAVPDAAQRGAPRARG
jgi:surface carbohydrate biosynthesis protein